MQDALGDQRVGRRRLEICTLPAVLPPASDHLESAILSSASADSHLPATRRDALSLRGLPVQFHQLPVLQGTLCMEKARGERWSRTGQRPRLNTSQSARHKKMVPSDPSTSSFSDRHARSEHGIRKRCDLSPLLPATGFARLRIDALVRVRLFLFR
jgi:hypothetical protein